MADKAERNPLSNGSNSSDAPSEPAPIAKTRMAETIKHGGRIYQLMVESVHDYAIFMLDPAGYIASWNKGAQKIKGYTADEIIGQHFSIFYKPEDIAIGHPQRELEIATAEGRFEEERPRLRKDGSEFWANVVITPVRDEDGTLVGFAKVTRDLTERRAAEQKAIEDARRVAMSESANVAKTEFLAAMSHELRTPLTAIQEGTALLLEEIPGPVTASQGEVLGVVRSHSERLFRSISSVLDLSKMEAGMMEYAPIPTDLASLIDRSIETVRLITQKKRVHLETAPASSLPLLSLDEGRIQQVLDNLLGNAVKFTPEGGTISVSATVADDGTGQGRWVEVRVSDSGIGIPAEEVERIFERFYQSPSHRGESVRGTGLGLAIARHVVEAHGGRIWAENREGKGSTFVFTLPVDENHQEEEQRKGNTLASQVGRSNAL